MAGAQNCSDVAMSKAPRRYDLISNLTPRIAMRQAKKITQLVRLSRG